MRSNTLDGVVAAALDRTGLVCAPAWAIADHVAAGRLQVVLRDFELPPRPINAVLTHHRLMAVKVRALLEYFAENLAKMDFDTVPPFRSAAGVADGNSAPPQICKGDCQFASFRRKRRCMIFPETGINRALAKGDKHAARIALHCIGKQQARTGASRSSLRSIFQCTPINLIAETGDMM